MRMGLGVGLHMVLVDYAATALTKKLEDGGTHLSSLNAALAGGEAQGTIEAYSASLKSRLWWRRPVAAVATTPVLRCYVCVVPTAVPRALATILLNPITIIKTRMEYSGTDAIK